ncbi:MAG TPA: hypothetical protein VH593_33900 [Ktedonobacteraceae bacterium]|jgi:hypothetical protein
MDNISTRSGDLSARSGNLSAGGGTAPAAPSYLTTQRRDSKYLRWWYAIASPEEPASLASFSERERFRRGRTGSQIILGFSILVIISFLAFQFFQKQAGNVGINGYFSYILVGVFVALVAATLANRMGLTNVAGFIVVITATAIPIADIVTTPGGVSMPVLPVYGLMVLPLVCAVSFLPPWSVFIVAAINSSFALYSLTSLPRTAELDAILAIAFAGILVPIIFIQVIVSVVAYVWVQGATTALSRADRAEELAKLEHDLAVQAEIASQQKQQLETSIKKIVEAHVRVANGDFEARVPLTQDNILWQISGSLNNLLARMQRLRQEAGEAQLAKAALHQARVENEKLVRLLEGRRIY